ncbi:MAG TPA: flagellar basal body rod C-terminal domain-containing protein, partial [Bryobacteraceae bacterium]|nr:flagellar basal body rod C-terminal domain-containing protein [Bryobacteraceae bacterium]
AISGTGFFALDAGGATLLTRNGNFRLSPDGTLTAAGGHKLRAQGGAALRLEARRPFEIAADGTLTQDGIAIGRIEVVEPEAGTALEKLGNGLLRVNTPGAPMRPAANAELRQGHLETANFAAPEAAVRLVTVMRHFEMLQRAATLTGEMNRQATEHVARATAA